jgi:excisionase family DNA binding protein
VVPKNSKPPPTRDDVVNKREAVDIATAAAYLGVSHRTIRRLIAQGKLPGTYRVGGGPIRVLIGDVEALKEPVAVND